MASSNFLNDPDIRYETGAACMSLSAGNFLVLKIGKRAFDWLFVNDDPDATEAITFLAMGICGVTNNRVKFHAPT
jgi:hypothetical protein